MVRAVERNDARNEPWWVALLVRIGPVAALALGLAYFLASNVTNALEHMKVAQSATQQLLMQHMSDIAIEKQYLRVLCINQAENHPQPNTAVQRCLAIEPR